MKDKSLKELTTLYNNTFNKKKKLGSITKAQMVFLLYPELHPDSVAIIVENIGGNTEKGPRETTHIFNSRKEAKRWLKDQLSEDEIRTFICDGWSFSCTAIERQQQFTSSMSYRQIIKGEVMKLADKKKSDQKKAKDKIKKAGKKAKGPKIHSADVVTLKEIHDDPRVARIALRSGIKKGTITHTANGRWEWKKGSKELNEVKKFLKVK
jgi:hypothetical protein